MDSIRYYIVSINGSIIRHNYVANDTNLWKNICLYCTRQTCPNKLSPSPEMILVHINPQKRQIISIAFYLNMDLLNTKLYVKLWRTHPIGIKQTYTKKSPGMLLKCLRKPENIMQLTFHSSQLLTVHWLVGMVYWWLPGNRLVRLVYSRVSQTRNIAFWLWDFNQFLMKWDKHQSNVPVSYCKSHPQSKDQTNS